MPERRDTPSGGVRATSTRRAPFARRRSGRWLLPLLPLVVGLALWQLAVVATSIPAIVVPKPAAVAMSFYQGVFTGLGDRSGFWFHAITTLTEAAIGLVLGTAVGLGLGVAIGVSRTMERMFYPYIVAFQGLPKVAMAPIFIVWFGFGMESKIALVTLVTFFPILVNTWTGIKGANPEMIAMARSFNASRWQVFRRVIFPGALPYVFAGLDIAVAYSIVGAIVSEFIGAQRGLGFLLEKMNYGLDMAGLFAIFVFLLIVGYLLNTLLGAVRRRYLFWIQSERMHAGT
jgi:NitT/TauT family transport system permease protein